MKNLILVSLFFIMMVFSSPLHAQTYRTERAYSNYFNPNSPDAYEHGNAINNNGVMLGSRRIDWSTFSQYDSFSYPPPFLLGNIGNAPVSHAVVSDLNDNNFKVGSCFYNSIDLVPCMWSPLAPLAYSLGFAGDYVRGFAFGINNNGKVIGTFTRSLVYPPLGPDDGAFIWDSENGMRLLGTLGGNYSRANSINDSGKVVGESDSQAFIWDAQNGMRPISNIIGNNPGWTFKTAIKINNNGHIIGVGSFGGSDGNFYWDGNAIYYLGPSPNPQNGLWGTYQLLGLNDSGQVTGIIYNPDQEGDWYQHAFVWDKDNGLDDLNDIVSVDGWVWETGVDVNNQGQILVDGRSNSGLTRAWIFTPKQIEPLIFIPGIGGSSLYEADENGNPKTPTIDNPVPGIWPYGVITDAFPGISLLSKLDLTPSSSSATKIVAVDAIDQITPAYKIYGPLLEKLKSPEIGYVQYDIQGNPKRRDVQCDPTYRDSEGRKPTLFVFAYDWRLPTEKAAEKLRAYIGCVQEFYQGQKVNLLAHSMGGLVARRYIIDYQSEQKVRRLITLGSPFLGAPKATDALFSGRFLEILGFYFREEAVKKIASYSPGLHELLPSEWYYDLEGCPSEKCPFAYRYPRLPLSFDYSYEETKKHFSRYFPSRPYDNNQLFHSYPNLTKRQDNWNTDSSGVKYYHIYGVVTGDGSTIGKVIHAPYIIYPNSKEQRQYGVELEYTKGDETVPSLSAKRAREDLNSFLLAPNTTLKRCSSPSYFSNRDYDHNGMTKNPIIWNEILAMIDDQVINQSPCVTETAPVGLKGAEKNGGSEGENLANDVNVNYLQVYRVDRLQITDEFGNTNTQINADADKAVPEIEYEYGSSSTASLVEPHDVTFVSGKKVDIKFVAPSEKIKVVISKGTSRNNFTEAVKYMDLQLPAGAMAWLKFTENGVENLRYDADGDGTFESEVQPTFTLTDAAANDKTPPIIDVSYSINNGEATVTANATDSETGINQIRYLVDDENIDHIYTAPFTINVSQSRLIYFSAEDNAGNRSLLARWLDLAPPTTTVNQTPPSNNAGWNISNVTVELKSIDDLGSSGVDTITYSGSGAQDISEETLFRKDPPFTFPKPNTAADFLAKTLNLYKEGITNLTFFAKDRAGNVEATKTYTVKIDKGNPISQHTSASDGQQTTFTLAATDAVSGVSEIVYSIDGGASQIYTTSFSVSNTGGHYVTYYAKDFAGNGEIPRTVYINAAHVPKSVLISEFRTRGYLGADDEFIELYNNGDIAVDISGWIINIKQGTASTPTVLATINNGVVIPARGHYLLRKEGTSNYSLSTYAEADQTYTGAMSDNVGIALFSNASIIIDAVGFSSVTDTTYREGTALAPSAGITSNGQYSFVRNYTSGGLLVDSNNNRADFIFVSTDGSTFNNLKSILGSPGPENLNSPIYKVGDVLVSQVDNTVTLAEAPNRVFDYSTTSPQYPAGILSVRRKLTNNTGNTIIRLKLRITAVTTKNSAVIFPQQALLRIINSTDTVPGSFSRQGMIPLKGLTIETIPTTIDGGMNSSLTLNLGSNGLANGDSLDIDLKSGIVTNGQYKLEFRVETITTVH